MFWCQGELSKEFSKDKVGISSENGLLSFSEEIELDVVPKELIAENFYRYRVQEEGPP